MTNKSVIKIIGSILIITLVTFLLNEFIYNEVIAYISIIATNIASLLGIYLLFHNSTIQKTIFWRIISVCIGILLVGVWMKILHWPNANLFITITLLGITLIYLIRFIKKDKKTHLDILKLFWILSACVIANLVLLHLLKNDFVIISRIFFWLTLLDFCLIEYGIIKLSPETIDQ